jgi:hypothetical protein
VDCMEFKALNSNGLARQRQAKERKTCANCCFLWTKNARSCPSTGHKKAGGCRLLVHKSEFTAC